VLSGARPLREAHPRSPRPQPPWVSSAPSRAVARAPLPERGSSNVTGRRRGASTPHEATEKQPGERRVRRRIGPELWGKELGPDPKTGYRSLAEEWADIDRTIDNLEGRTLQEELTGLHKARRSLPAAVPRAAERARKAIEERGLEWPWAPEGASPAEGEGPERAAPEHPTAGQDDQR